MKFKINQKSETPIYRQIVEYIEGEIKSGHLLPDTKIPTFRSLSESLGVSLGTVKRAYDELEHNGTITMTQGRGSFIADKSEFYSSSKKETAMEIIENTIKTLINLPLSPLEIKIFFDLKLRELEEDAHYIKIVLIECTIEALLMIDSRLSELRNIDVEMFLLDDFVKNPAIVSQDADLYVTTFTHVDIVKEILKGKHELMGIVMATSFNTVVQISKIHPDEKVAIITPSPIFAGMINNGYNKFLELNKTLPTFYLRADKNLQKFIDQYDKLILPNSFYRIAPEEEAEIINKAKQNGKIIISYDYEIDKGSFVYLNEKIEELRSKSSQLIF